MSARGYRKQFLAAAAVSMAFGRMAFADTVGYWRFEEGIAGQPAGSSSSIIDSSGMGNNGTAINGPVYTSNTPVTNVPATGAADSLAMNFNGSNQRIFVPDSSSLAITASLTIEAYVYSRGGYGMIVFRGDDRGGLDPYALYYDGSQMAFHVGNAAGQNLDIKAAFPLNQWNFVAGTLDDSTGTMDLYVNGTLGATASTTIRPLGPLNSNYQPGLGIANVQSSNYSDYFNGMLDEVRVSNTALSPNQFLSFPGGAAPGPSQWGVDSAGDWNNYANWTGAVPNGVGADAEFLGKITAAHTVYTDTPVTAGTIHFNNANTYVLTGAGNLTLQAAAGTSALVQVDQGTQKINLPTTIASNTTFNVAPGATLLVANPLNVNSNISLSQSGGGTVTYQSIVTVQTGGSISFANSTTGNSLNLKINSAASIAPNSNALVQFNNISLGSGAKFDIANNALAVNFASPAADPVQAIASYLASGYLNGLWTGTGINSSIAAAGPSSPTLSVGYADGNTDTGTPAAPNQILVKYTLAGDANLDGLVNFADLVAVVQNFSKAGTDWAQGNFGYGTSTNFGDLVAVIQNFNKVLSPAGDSGAELGGTPMPLIASVTATDVQVPEPGTATIFLLTSAGLLACRRRRANESK
jgi:hypothetical protein